MATEKDWQPIETAPKDGTDVLAFRGGEYRQVSIMAWDKNEYAKKPRPYWRASWSFENVGSQRLHQPTHWMPLPDAPTEVAK